MPGWTLLATLLQTVAAAQVAGLPPAPAPPAGGYRIDARVSAGGETGDIRARIDDGRRTGQLSRSEARALRRETGQLGTLGARYGADGLSSAEARELRDRAEVLRDRVNTRRSQGFGTTHPRRR